MYKYRWISPYLSNAERNREWKKEKVQRIFEKWAEMCMNLIESMLQIANNCTVYWTVAFCLHGKCENEARSASQFAFAFKLLPTSLLLVWVDTANKLANIHQSQMLIFPSLTANEHFIDNLLYPSLINPICIWNQQRKSDSIFSHQNGWPYAIRGKK